MDFQPPPVPHIAAIVCEHERPHDGPESAQSRVIPILRPVSGYTLDSGGNVQGGVIRHESLRIDWE